MPEVIINEIDPKSKEGKALIKKLDESIQASKDYVDSYGGKSYEGFIETEDGPKGIDNGD